MASLKLSAALLACCALGVSARLIEQVAVGTDSFAIVEVSDKEAIPFEVIESKDAYEIRKYEGGRILGALHYHCSLAYERGCPQLDSAARSPAACRHIRGNGRVSVAIHNILHQGMRPASS